MLFNSFTFLAFFAVVAGVYYGLPHRARWMWLLGASLFFYGTFSVPYLVLLLGTTLVTYAMGLAIGGATTPGAKRAALTAGVVLVLSALFVFKYYEFFRQSADLVLVAAGLGSLQGWPRLSVAAIAGLSFYTFSSVSYLADVYWGRARPERHVGRFTLYASFFPKLLAGPLERAQPFLDQVDRPLSFDPVRVSSGLQQMLWGLFKKVVIADRLAGFVDTAYQLPGLASPADLVLATYFFAFQLYCDFSGYSDLAIGAARVLGFDLMANFSRPYLSTSIQEFWAARWHLSLSAWLRDYLYIPLGGSRTSPLRRAVNVMIVFLVSGLWHGANWTFVVWGGANGAYQVISMTAKRLLGRESGPSSSSSPLGIFVRRVVTFHLVLATWVFFRAATLGDAVTVLSRVGRALARLPALLQVRLKSGDVLISVALIVLLLVAEGLDERKPVWERLRARPLPVRWAVYYLLLIALAVLGTWNFQQFVYMQF